LTIIPAVRAAVEDTVVDEELRAVEEDELLDLEEVELSELVAVVVLLVLLVDLRCLSGSAVAIGRPRVAATANAAPPVAAYFKNSLLVFTLIDLQIVSSDRKKRRITPRRQTVF
jgi:hypothetical protein